MEKWEAEDGDKLRRFKTESFIKAVAKNGGIEEFDVDLYLGMVKYYNIQYLRKALI